MAIGSEQVFRHRHGGLFKNTIFLAHSMKLGTRLQGLSGANRQRRNDASLCGFLKEIPMAMYNDFFSKR